LRDSYLYSSPSENFLGTCSKASASCNFEADGLAMCILRDSC
jgi:hypothetical protein